jgi:hypothetical protein
VPAPSIIVPSKEDLEAEDEILDEEKNSWYDNLRKNKLANALNQ